MRGGRSIIQVQHALSKARQSLRENREIAAASALSFGIRILWAASGFAMAALLARALDPVSFGVFAASLSLALFLQQLLSLGQGNGAIRFVAAYMGGDDPGRALQYLAWSRRLTLSALAAFAVLGAAVWAMTESLFGGDAATVIALGASFGLVLTAANLIAMRLRSLGFLAAALLPRDVAWRLVLVGIASASLMLDFAVSPTLAFAIAALVLVIFGAVQVEYLRRFWNARAPRSEREVEDRTDREEWRSTTSFLGASQTLSAVLTQADVLLVAIMFGAAEAGLYFAAQRIAMLISLFLTAANAYAAPQIAKFHHQGRTDELRWLTTLVSVFALAPALIAFAALIALGGSFLNLFGDDFQSVYAVLIVLGARQVISAAAGPALHLLNMTGNHAAVTAVNAASAVAHLLLVTVLGFAFGLVGAAVGALIACALQNLAAALWVWRKLGIVTLLAAVLRLPNFLDREPTS